MTFFSLSSLFFDCFLGKVNVFALSQHHFSFAPLIHQKISLNSRNSIFKRSRTENFFLVDFYFLIFAFTYIKQLVSQLQLVKSPLLFLALFDASFHFCNISFSFVSTLILLKTGKPDFTQKQIMSSNNCTLTSL